MYKVLVAKISYNHANYQKLSNYQKYPNLCLNKTYDVIAVIITDDVMQIVGPQQYIKIWIY